MISKRATLVLVSEVKKARRATSSELKAVMMEHGIEVSACTIRCQLNREGFKSQVAIKKPKLTPDKMKKRLAFAQKYVDYTAEDWKRVSD